MRKLAITALLAVMLALPAIAVAERIPSWVSIHKSAQEDRIFGVMQAPKHKCEKQRRIILFHTADKDFVPVDETTSNNLGEYEFDTSKNPMPKVKRGGQFPNGLYFVRALRKKAGNDVCKRAESREIEMAGA